MSVHSSKPAMAGRFRGFLPVVIDLETSGLDPETNAILQISATMLNFEQDQTTSNSAGPGQLNIGSQYNYEIIPFADAQIDPASLKINHIDPFAADRDAQDEAEALKDLFKKINTLRSAQQCVRAIMVGHNVNFDHSFLNSACARHRIKNSPFHPFSCLDTLSLAALAYKETVLAKACVAAGIDFQPDLAHTASYDSTKTAQLFCNIVNKWERLAYA